VKRLAPILFACLALVGAGCGDSDDSSTSSSESTATSTESSGESSTESGGSAKESGRVVGRAEPEVTVPSGPPPKKLEIKDLEKGTGATAKTGDEVTVQYTGVGYDSEEEFDSSWSSGEPFAFPLGAGMVIKGWDQGVAGMKVGGRRELIIPANLAYGPEGRPPSIGPNETLIFVIDLLAVE
jgi:FKBP-type peptidyl-prolyl cis-trans isomerase